MARLSYGPLLLKLVQVLEYNVPRIFRIHMYFFMLLLDKFVLQPSLGLVLQNLKGSKGLVGFVLVVLNNLEIQVPDEDQNFYVSNA